MYTRHQIKYLKCLNMPALAYLMSSEWCNLYIHWKDCCE